MAKEILGQTANLSKSSKQKLALLAEMSCPKNEIISAEMAALMSEITLEINKEIAVYIDRFGNVAMVSVGNDMTAPLPNMSKKRKD